MNIQQTASAFLFGLKIKLDMTPLTKRHFC